MIPNTYSKWGQTSDLRNDFFTFPQAEKSAPTCYILIRSLI